MVRHSDDRGSIASTRTQASELLAALGVPPDVGATVLAAFEPWSDGAQPVVTGARAVASSRRGAW